MPDWLTLSNVYFEASNAVTYPDENGPLFSNTFDALGRKTSVEITLTSGVSCTTAQSSKFEGLSRMTVARDSVGDTNADAKIVYDFAEPRIKGVGG